MPGQKHQVIITGSTHRSLKEDAREAAMPMDSYLKKTIQINNERIEYEFSAWFDVWKDKDLLIKGSNASKLTILTAIHLRETGVIDNDEFRILLMSESGRDIIDLLLETDIEKRRGVVEKYDVKNNTLVD